MPPCFCSSTPKSTSISKFISNQPYLTMLENNCTTRKDLKKIHAQLIKTGLIKDTIAASRVLAFAATSSASDVNYAYLVFHTIESPNLFTWNTMIRGFSESSTPQNAIFLFMDMLVTSSVQPQKLTYPSVFKAYSRMGLAKCGTQLHGRIIKLGLESDPFIQNSIIHMYANCGFLMEARKLFDEDKVMDVVPWNSMIMGHAKCGEIDDSLRLFSTMPHRNAVSWNSMISGYVRNGKYMEAMNLFKEMQEEEVEPSEYTLVSLLNACANLGALKQGKWIHDYIRKNCIENNVIVVTALIDLYCKCGEIEMARQVFESARTKGLSSWNSMILGLALNGCADDAIQFFSRLVSSSLDPDSVSFVAVLAACSHSGMVDQAKGYLEQMQLKYNIEPSIQHYGCLVDVLGRAGLVEEAERLIRSMPIAPDVGIWGSLLSACRSVGNLEMAKWAAEKLVEMDPDDECGYLLMSNIYSASGHHESALQERILMKQRQIHRVPGCSTIDVNGQIREFTTGGMLHSEADQDFYDVLDNLVEFGS